VSSRPVRYARIVNRFGFCFGFRLRGARFCSGVGLAVGAGASFARRGKLSHLIAVSLYRVIGDTAVIRKATVGPLAMPRQHRLHPPLPIRARFRSPMRRIQRLARKINRVLKRPFVRDRLASFEARSDIGAGV